MGDLESATKSPRSARRMTLSAMTELDKSSHPCTSHYDPVQGDRIRLMMRELKKLHCSFFSNDQSVTMRHQFSIMALIIDS